MNEIKAIIQPFMLYGVLSRLSHAIIKQNLWISLGAIALLMPSTLFGWAGISLAVIFHEGSTLIGVFNALRLLRYKTM